jgi:hypothetical protein
MAEKKLQPRAGGAQVARAAGTTKAVAAIAPGRKLDRYILPSRHVLAVMQPNVGEFIELRERSAIRASKDSAEPTQAEFAYHLGMLAMRKLVKGITLSPVPVIYVDGFDKADAAPRMRAQAEQDVATHLDELRAAHARRVNGTQTDKEKGLPLPALPTDDEVPDIIAGVAARLLDNACFDAEDSDAMREAANIVPVTDFMWDAKDAYINSIKQAELGTVEAADFIAINAIMVDTFKKMVSAASGGAAKSEGPFGVATGPTIRPYR